MSRKTCFSQKKYVKHFYVKKFLRFFLRKHFLNVKQKKVPPPLHIRKILKRPDSELFLIWDNFARPISAILRNFPNFLSPAIFSYSGVLDVAEIDPEIFLILHATPQQVKKIFSALRAKESWKKFSALRAAIASLASFS